MSWSGVVSAVLRGGLVRVRTSLRIRQVMAENREVVRLRFPSWKSAETVVLAGTEQKRMRRSLVRISMVAKKDSPEYPRMASVVM